MALHNFKACEKDTCDMPFPSPSGSLKKQFDSAVIKEAKKTYNECRKKVKLHLIRRLPLQSMQQNTHFKFFLCHFCI